MIFVTWFNRRYDTQEEESCESGACIEERDVMGIRAENTGHDRLHSIRESIGTSDYLPPQQQVGSVEMDFGDTIVRVGTSKRINATNKNSEIRQSFQGSNGSSVVDKTEIGGNTFVPESAQR